MEDAQRAVGDVTGPGRAPGMGGHRRLQQDHSCLHREVIPNRSQVTSQGLPQLAAGLSYAFIMSTDWGECCLCVRWLQVLVLLKKSRRPTQQHISYSTITRLHC